MKGAQLIAPPPIGLGTWQIQGEECTEIVKKALEIGYRHIDTAQMYGNEEAIGKALREFGQEEVFITTKIWPDTLNADKVYKEGLNSIRKLGVDTIDLLLLHWPKKEQNFSEIAKGFKRLINEGKVKSVGVSNFTIRQLEEALVIAGREGVAISANQVEYHPLLNQEDLRLFCQEQSIKVIAYSPLARGEIVHHELLKEVAEKYGMTPAQVALRWLMQKGIFVIPKATSFDHLHENFDSLEFTLESKDIAKINAIQEKKRLINPTWADFND